MGELKQSLTVARAAAMCGVSRNTVGLWIRSKKLHAVRKGRNYSIPNSELLFFLKSNRREIPAELAGETSLGPHFRPIQKCWDYFQNGKYLNGCSDCAVYRNRLEVCFIGKDAAAAVCSGKCSECRYFQETFLPRFQLVHQVNMPAAVTGLLSSVAMIAKSGSPETLIPAATPVATKPGTDVTLMGKPLQ